MAINITDLDISQLADVKKQLDDELAHLSSSFTQLRQAQAKFKSCIYNIRHITPENKRHLFSFFTIPTTHPSTDKSILVPLTNSLYVPGHLSDPDHVIVDVGTGYFIKKTRPQAVTYYSEKVDYLESNLSSLEDLITKKRDNQNYVTSLLQAKFQAQVEAKS